MLILAGVAISAITGDGGLFEKTRNAADAYEQAAQSEADQIKSLMNDIDSYLNKIPGDPVTPTEPDTVEPTVATIEASNIEETTFTLTAKGKDETGIAKYEFYIDGTLEKIETTGEETVTYEVTGKTGSTSYTCYVKVYDAAGNAKQSDSIIVTTKSSGTAIAQVVSVGDYVNYDAGTWTEADFTKITSSTGSPTVNKSTSLPSTQGQFGGFTVGQSRNTNSTEYDSSYKPRTAGWRVWSIEGDIVTLISAGHPETYYHGGNSSASINILRNRDCSMYENEYAKTGSARILTGQDAANWYNEQYGTNYAITENSGANSTFYHKEFSRTEPISVLEIGAWYRLASAANYYSLYIVMPDSRGVGYNGDKAYGIRVLVYLKSGVKVEPGSGDGSIGNPWKLMQ